MVEGMTTTRERALPVATATYIPPLAIYTVYQCLLTALEVKTDWQIFFHIQRKEDVSSKHPHASAKSVKETARRVSNLQLEISVLCDE
jgi:hypothetical protein